MWLMTHCNGLHQLVPKDHKDSQSLLHSQSQPQLRRLRATSKDQCCLQHQQLPLQSSMRLLSCPLSSLNRLQVLRSQQQHMLRVLRRHGQRAMRSWHSRPGTQRYQEVSVGYVSLLMEPCWWRSLWGCVQTALAMQALALHLERLLHGCRLV